MTVEFSQIGILAFASLFAGFIDSVVGGGGLIQIPAIFSVTQDPFIVMTSNIFAILGLRALYFLLADIADRFHLLKYGLAAVLTFIGMKMLLLEVFHIPVVVSLAVVFLLLTASIVASLLVSRKTAG